MCLTIPAKIVYIHAPSPESPFNKITVEDSNGLRELKSLIPEEISLGDWVLYNADAAVQRIDACDAQEIIDLLEHKRDFDLSALDPEFTSIFKNRSQRKLFKSEIMRLLKTNNSHELEALFSEANIIRQTYLKDFFCIHGIVEFSNYCQNSCKYCGLSKDSSNVRRYRIEPDEIYAIVENAVTSRGYKLIVLQSGDDNYYSDDMLVKLIRKIKKRLKVFIFLSVGEREIEGYRNMKEAGANGVLYRFETSNPKLYANIHPEEDLQDRLKNIKAMKEMGYYVASGFLIGLPGQTISDITDDILLTQELGINMISAGPFIPSDNTALSGYPAGDAMMTLKTIAICRLLMPRAKIPVTTAFETIKLEEGRRLALSSGANSLMFNLTPERYRDDYAIYPDRYHGEEKMWERYGLSKETLSYKMLEKKMAEGFE